MLKSLDTRDELFPNCPIRNVLARVGDKWSLLVMVQLKRNAHATRFSELDKAIPDISQKVLASTLRNLEEDGFVVRTAYPEVPPRVEYQLTDRALSFLIACQPMIDWSLVHLSEIVKEREKRRASKL